MDRFGPVASQLPTCNCAICTAISVGIDVQLDLARKSEFRYAKMSPDNAMSVNSFYNGGESRWRGQDYLRLG